VNVLHETSEIDSNSAVSQFGVIGPYFFEEEGMTVTVNSARYVSMLLNFLQPRMEEIVED
jgi:hypothetical protein